MIALPNPFEEISCLAETPAPGTAVPSPSVGETFSEYAARRSYPKVSPPLPAVVRSVDEWLIDPEELFKAIDPRPELGETIAQRVPSELLIRALLDAAGEAA
jgi:hypothetical protein